MLARINDSSRRRGRLLNRLAMLMALVIILNCDAVVVWAQNNFNSGSTGADGAFAPTANQEVQIPESGVFNFTTVNIPSGVRITFRRNSKNTPVTMLASGNVTILGTIDVSGGDGRQSVFDGGRPNGGGLGGPGGFNGGGGGFSFAPFFLGSSGDGPGGGSTGPFGGGGGFAQDGQASCGGGRGGQRYGARTLIPLIGGSGGGGQSGGNGSNGGGGGGGGGAILIASSGTITFGPNSTNRGSIFAKGGTRLFGGSAGGSGGAIRLIANTMTGFVQLNVQAGAGGCGNDGGHGYLRIEAFNFTGFQAQTIPGATFDNQPIISLAQPNPVTLLNAPQLRIASIAGIAAPAMPAGSFGSNPDIVIPTGQASPATLAIEASNIPVGTVVEVRHLFEGGTYQTANSTALSGTTAASTATASINLPSSGMSVVTVTVTFTPTEAMGRAIPLMIDGERVDRVLVSATFGGNSETTYITRSGRHIRAQAY